MIYDIILQRLNIKPLGISGELLLGSWGYVTIDDDHMLYLVIIYPFLITLKPISVKLSIADKDNYLLTFRSIDSIFIPSQASYVASSFHHFGCIA
jgi:hypothetical protein